MQYRGFFSRLSIMAIVVVLTFSAVVITPAWSQSADTDTRQGTAGGVGMQLAAFGATIPYFVGKTRPHLVFGHSRTRITEPGIHEQPEKAS